MGGEVSSTRIEGIPCLIEVCLVKHRCEIGFSHGRCLGANLLKRTAAVLSASRVVLRPIVSHSEVFGFTEEVSKISEPLGKLIFRAICKTSGKYVGLFKKYLSGIDDDS